jgi:hypothetical protein
MGFVLARGIRVTRSGADVERRRNGMIEFDDPDTGNHVVILDGMTVETAPGEAIGIVSIVAIVRCSACSRRRIMPVEVYHDGWDSCVHCGARIFLPLLGPGPHGG